MATWWLPCGVFQQFSLAAKKTNFAERKVWNPVWIPGCSTGCKTEGWGYCSDIVEGMMLQQEYQRVKILLSVVNTRPKLRNGSLTVWRASHFLRLLSATCLCEIQFSLIEPVLISCYTDLISPPGSIKLQLILSFWSTTLCLMSALQPHTPLFFC